jgi:baseplate J-like protein|nr:MAG TPA: Baseplate J like protein [Caudoviricetes sp.]
MSKEISFEKTMSRMLDTISDDFDKRETSIIYQAVAMVVPELMLLQSDIELMEEEAFPDSCNYNSLVRFSGLRNIHPRQATRGVVIAEFSKDIEIGARFNCEERNYEVLEKINTNKYKLIAEETGHIESIGDLTPIKDMPDLRTAKITSVYLDGREEESLESLRKRYMESLDYQAFGGNRADYIEKVTSVDGVGACKVFRRPKATSSEVGKITIVIVDTTYKNASSELIKNVASILTPTEDGEGAGLAPIGHKITVVGAEKQTVNIKTRITVERDIDNITRDLTKAIEEYLHELRSGFGSDEATVVRISAIENKILGIKGVIDVSNTTINGVEKNLTIEDKSIPVIGEVEYDRL